MIITNSIYISDKNCSKIEEEYDCFIEDLFEEHGMIVTRSFGDFGDIQHIHFEKEADISLLDELSEYIESNSNITFTVQASCNVHVAFFNGKSSTRYPRIEYYEQ